MPIYTLQSDRVAEESARRLKNRFRTAIGALLLTALISTSGFILLDPHPDDPLSERTLIALWDTVNLVSTVGSLDESINNTQRIWSMFVITFGLGAVLYGFGTIQALFQGEVLHLYGRKKMEKQLDSLHDHYILCGCGLVGGAVARDLKAHRVPYIIIENNSTLAESIDASDPQHHVIVGDATRDDTMKRAGIENARGLIASLGTDAANVYLILMARELSPDIRIVARAERAESITRLERAGADQVIVPGEIAGLRLANLALRPHISRFVDALIQGREYDFAEIPIRAYATLEGKTLRDLNLTRAAEALVISIVDGQGHHRFNPPADHELSADDTLLVVCKEGGLERLEQLGNEPM